MLPPTNTSWVLVSAGVALAAYVATVRRRIVDRIREIKDELEESEKGVAERIVVVVDEGSGQAGTSTRTTTRLLSDDKRRKL